MRRKATSIRDLGTRFEVLTKQFLLTDKLYRARFSKVWMWGEWEGNDGPDTGIDLIAEERVGGDGKGANSELCAIQCKCYDDSDGSLDMKSVSTFLAKTAALNIRNKILVYTGSSMTSHARKLLEDHRCSIITSSVFRDSTIDWGGFPRLKQKEPKRLYEYQEAARRDVIAGFLNNDRGKLIMACGTGKTLVSLRIAEEYAGVGGTVLYLVPSISLILQTMREWSSNAAVPHYYMAVCSDSTVRNEEQGTLTELEAPASTDVDTLAGRMSRSRDDALNVVFSTYNSIGVVSSVMTDQKKPAADRFDIVFCDEAHRTTGVEDSGPAGRRERSYYTKVHDNALVPASKRLYMTATPRIYTDHIKGRAAEQEKEVISMDDAAVFGPVLHELTFYDAVHKYGALCDFKVRVSVMDGDTMDGLVQRAQAGEERMVPLDEKVLMASVWHAIQHPGAGDAEDGDGLLQRVIMFCDMINSSRIVAGEKIVYRKDIREDPKELEQAKRVDARRSFAKLVEHIDSVTGKNGSRNRVSVKHVDGGDSAQNRRRRLEWLKESGDEPGVCRILSNARCLSEGVDVPALDGVVFLNPRKSVVDVVQAVGRVMRKSRGKKYGYVILPVAIPAGIDIGEALDNSRYFKVVWQVLNALRSHDPRLAEEVNKLTLEREWKNSDITNRIIIRHAYTHGLLEPSMPEPRMIHGITSRLIRKVGDIDYYDRYGRQLGEKSAQLESQIERRMQDDPDVRRGVHELQDGLRRIINDSVTERDVVRTLAQHMVMSRVFDALFRGEFASHNPVSNALNGAIDRLRLSHELSGLGKFYAEVRRELDGVTTREGRQNLIKKIYENFFKAAAKKETEQHGVVYTPVEIIDFILCSVQDILQDEFGTSFASRAVKVMDPFAGTGTFLSRLLESGMLGDAIYEKYTRDMYANEMILLAYYVATVNIETTYQSLRKDGKYVPFGGMSYTDTLEINPRYREDKRHRQADTRLDETFRQAHERIRHQQGAHLHVVVGNPPYSAGQSNYNDQSQNAGHPEIDERIRDTYLNKTKSINPNIGLIRTLYDSYIRSIRWASDRIGESGIIGFVTNASFIRSESAAGLRACLQEEFTDVWVFDLRGNARTQGEERKKEAGTVFGGGSRAPVAVTILVRNPQKEEGCTIHYKDIGDSLTREQKLAAIRAAGSINGIHDWHTIKPDRHHDWVEQRDDTFDRYLPIGSKKAKKGIENAAFKFYSNGVATARDAWAYNSSIKELSKNMKRHILYCNSYNLDNPKIDSTQAKWDSELSRNLKKYGLQKFTKTKIRSALYRPFFKQFLYFDHIFNPRQGACPAAFPQNGSENQAIAVPDKEVGEKFSVLVMDETPDLHPIAQSQCFPLKSKSTRERKNLCIIVPYKVQSEFSVFITDMIPDLELVHHGQVFPMRVIEK